MCKIEEQQIRELKEIITMLQEIDSQLFFEEICSLQAKIVELEKQS